MIKIAICDDSREEVVQIQKVVDKIQKELKEDIKGDYYLSSMKLADIVRNPEEVRHDIYILDIDMPDINGLELAAIINRWNPVAIVFFLTSHLEYASEGYKVNAVRYVYKEKMHDQLREAIIYAIEQSKEIQKKSITLTHYRDCHRVRMSDIVYVQRVGRQLEIHVSRKHSITIASSLEELFNRLSDSRFVYIERGCFINIDYVYKVTKRSVFLTDGTELTISRRLIAEIKEKITELWNEGL